MGWVARLRRRWRKFTGKALPGEIIIEWSTTKSINGVKVVNTRYELCRYTLPFAWRLEKSNLLSIMVVPDADYEPAIAAKDPVKSRRSRGNVVVRDRRHGFVYFRGDVLALMDSFAFGGGWDNGSGDTEAIHTIDRMSLALLDRVRKLSEYDIGRVMGEILEFMHTVRRMPPVQRGYIFRHPTLAIQDSEIEIYQEASYAGDKPLQIELLIAFSQDG